MSSSVQRGISEHLIRFGLQDLSHIRWLVVIIEGEIIIKSQSLRQIDNISVITRVNDVCHILDLCKANPRREGLSQHEIRLALQLVAH